MAKAAKVTGQVQYAVGDGPVETIPEGAVELEIADDSTVVTWMHEGESMTLTTHNVETCLIPLSSCLVV